MRFLITISFACLFNHVYGQLAVAKYGNEFLNMGVGAKGIAMQKAQASQVNGTTATFWNPAGMVGLQTKSQGSLMFGHNSELESNQVYGGLVSNIDSMSTVGVSFYKSTRNSLLDTRFIFEESEEPNFDKSRTFSAHDYAFFISYGKYLPWVKGLKFGGSAKIIHQNYGNFSNTWGVGFDLGLQLPKRQWNFGVVAKDITGTFMTTYVNSELFIDVNTQEGTSISEKTHEVILPNLVLAISRRVSFANDQIKIIAALDFDVTFDGQRNVLISSDLLSLNPHAGFELNYKNIISLRTGIGDNQEVTNSSFEVESRSKLNYGFGIKRRKMAFDYGIDRATGEVKNLITHVFSLTIDV